MRVHIKNNWLVNNISLISSDLISQLNDLVLYLQEVSVFLSFVLDGELCPGSCSLRLMVETELKWTSRHNTISSWEEVKTDNRLKNGGFTGRLGSKHSDSWQLDELLDSYISQLILTYEIRSANAHWKKV